jgi:hypothetical protein
MKRFCRNVNPFKSTPARRNTMSTSVISVEQRFALLAAMGANIDWDSLTIEQIQAGIKNPQLTGKQATLFIRSGYSVQIGEHFRETGDVSIQLPALKRPTLKELQASNDWIKSIERDTSTEEAVTLTFATVLVPDDGSSIDGKEYEKRIALKHDSLLGFQHRQWLLEHQAEFPEFMALLGKCYVDFPGIVVVNRDGDRVIPYCNQNGSRWDDFWSWLSNDFAVLGRIAVGK